MSTSLLKTIRLGRHYMKTWPMVRQLGYYFPEYRVMRATQLALPVTPALAIGVMFSQLYLLGWDVFPQTLAMTLFFLSLPVQGLIWLGWRAQHPLPLTLLDWGNQLSAKLQHLGVSCHPLGANARYQDMANILKLAFERLEPKYWEEL
ncbi:DUF412 domain-containing protein [Shewanella sp. SNU WT4]|uniref:terminus macrodomain insulation protein YfbV n=1 Tax=Shewanella sp. SNU WT4 TaxID=2590015 RepID=UPI0011298BBA|nr:terminus macrodomain insulation protein YfbV [Shewanella sp. SNU WT4]QDF67467.1 DUF412 domain-containing protein [Shewanella sp. SNU WT4]